MDTKPVSALLCDNDSEFIDLCSMYLAYEGIDVCSCPCSVKEILKTVRELSFDVAIINHTLSDGTSFDVAQALAEEGLSTGIAVVSDRFDYSFETAAANYGISNALLKPFELTKLVDVINGIVTARTLKTESFGLFEYANGLLVKSGIPSGTNGEKYLLTAVTAAARNKDLICNVTKTLYPYIAQKYGTTATGVERAIRHAIETAFMRAAPDALYEIFGETVSAERGKPTNTEFISRISELLRLRLEAGIK